uniref:Glutathione S-transferase omega 1 n=1 Tax=Lasioderma serricorne TaxID=295660 RepID=A0A8F2PSK1_9COLE|nr:glutathione S-transferase omega 1 [Lasioderma serricorne]
MSSKHLEKGSEQPPKVKAKLRLYSMEYCPYAHRVRLILLAKGVDHDIVNINLLNKPEWYFNIHPEGKVPALVTDDDVIVESLTIADYLEQKYPEPALYPAEPEAQERDKALIAKIDPLSSLFGKILFSKEDKSAAEWSKELVPLLEEFEKELESRATPYFFGDTPGMVDYMLWPFAERAGAIGIKLNGKLPLEDDELVLLRKWRKLMRNHPVVSKIYHGPEKFYKTVLFKTAGIPADYNNV